MMRVKSRFISAFATLVFACFVLFPCTAAAMLAPVDETQESTITIEEVSTVIGENYVRYPQLSGLRDPAIEQNINNDIVTFANIAQRLITLSTLQQGGTGLQVSYTAYLNDNLFSVVISAKGMMENFRSGHAYTALSYDLSSGLRLQMSDFFTDPDTAVGWMEDQLLSGYADELSNYLEYAELTPLPVDSFAFDENGITFYYPYSQFALLSGYSGSVQFQYGELQDFLLTADGSIPARLELVIPQYSDAEIREQIEATAAEGTLPGLPVALNDSISGLIGLYRLVRTPDQYPGGRYFQLEAPAFRQVLILSDALTSSYESSVVEGILVMRMNLYGIRTGLTPRSRWLQVLGEPNASVELDSSISSDYGLPPGTADYYTVSQHQLMLYADADGVLYAVRLTK